MGRENGDVLERPTSRGNCRPIFHGCDGGYQRDVSAICKGNGSKTAITLRRKEQQSLYREGEALFPVVNVSWDEAQGSPNGRAKDFHVSRNGRWPRVDWTAGSIRGETPGRRD
jgi:hypothetical protein